MIRLPCPGRSLALLALLAPLVLVPAHVAAQGCDDGVELERIPPSGDAVQEVTLVGGTTYAGRIIDAGDPVRFELLSGDVLEIRRERIRCIRPIEGRVSGTEHWPPDRNTTRLFFGPTARALPSGTGYISVFEVVMPFVAVGASDRLTLAGGMPLFITEEGVQTFWLAPKLEVMRTDRFRGAVGALGFFSPGEIENFGVLYAVGTFGASSDRAVTVGAGWAYDSRSGIHDAPAVMAGFETRVSKGVKLISENYLVPDEGIGIVSFGPRFFGERLSADLGLAMPFGDGAPFFVFPLVNFVWNW